MGNEVAACRDGHQGPELLAVKVPVCHTGELEGGGGCETLRVELETLDAPGRELSGCLQLALLSKPDFHLLVFLWIVVTWKLTQY